MSSDASFLDAVAHHAAHRLGEPDITSPPHSDPEHVRRLEAERIIRLADIAATFDDAAIALASDATMLAAFFQNLDLLFTHDSPHGDVVARLLGRALEFSAEMKTP